MPKIIEVTTSDGQSKEAHDDIKVLINADLVIKIEDTKDNYAGDTCIHFMNGETLYTSESFEELKALLM